MKRGSGGVSIERMGAWETYASGRGKVMLVIRSGEHGSGDSQLAEAVELVFGDFGQCRGDNAWVGRQELGLQRTLVILYC